MLMESLKQLFDGNAREVNKLRKKVEEINLLEDQIGKLSQEEMQAKTRQFREMLGELTARKAPQLEIEHKLDEILPEAFAMVREAAKRTIGLRHFDVQMIGGIVLHQGRISEMKTGEGKTLVATLPLYLNALVGKGAHLITVNDYLAKRDSRWMAPVYHYLGLSVGVIQHESAFLYDPEYEIENESLNNLCPVHRREAYRADITYGTNNEFGFDYLRDNMVLNVEDCAQRELYYAIVDEVDSILIDEARTPLIISGRAAESTDLYAKFSRLAGRLSRENDYTVDEKAHSVPLTDDGVKKVEEALGIENLYDNIHMELAHHINQALRAKELYKNDVDYVMKDGQIIIVDEFTGRLMFGRRYSDGLHQAIEAKENVKVRQEDQTLATITFQNYFRMYVKLSGMTGTAATEEKEFRDIYNLDVVVIPTNRPMSRKDNPDVVFRTEKAKFEAVVEDIIELNKKGCPILVGTRSIERSEFLGLMLKRRGIPHQILNAKYHEKEAQIIAQAGREGAVTIATNMAGRGVDIIMGGNPPDPEAAKRVKEAGGLQIIGTERHESRRIDNQLRGRSGRQGDPGLSRFYVSLEDELMRLFGSDKINSLMESLGVTDDLPIEHSFISKGIENAQKKVESHHYDIRKQVLDYDDVMNKQREVIYGERRRVLEGEDIEGQIRNMLEMAVDSLLSTYVSNEIPSDEWDFEGLYHTLRENFPLPLEARASELVFEKISEIKDKIMEWVLEIYKEKESRVGSEIMRQLERYVLLRIIDEKWMDHLYSMDILREGIGLRAYGQKDPKIEYINEAFEMFEGLKRRIQEETVKYLVRVEVRKGEMAENKKYQVTREAHGDDGEGGGRTVVRKGRKVGRNDPCPCNSGKKYKKCCGVNE